MRRQAAAGEMTLAYLDEAGFAHVHPNRSAWTPVGEQPGILAVRGQRLNVVAALLSTGQVFSAKLWCALNARRFAGFLGLLREHVDKPLTVILDNASIPKARAVEPLLEVLRRQGVTRYFYRPTARSRTASRNSGIWSSILGWPPSTAMPQHSKLRWARSSTTSGRGLNWLFS